MYPNGASPGFGFERLLEIHRRKQLRGVHEGGVGDDEVELDLFAVGDGMGSGKNANDLSERAVKTIENFFEAGFSEDVVMEMSNKILTRHATGDGFSAVD